MISSGVLWSVYVSQTTVLVLALCLGLVFNEICIPLTGACVYHCYISEGLVVLWDHINCICIVATTVYRQELNSEDSGEQSNKCHIGDSLIHGEGLVAIQGGVTRPKT